MTGNTKKSLGLTWKLATQADTASSLLEIIQAVPFYLTFKWVNNVLPLYAYSYLGIKHSDKAISIQNQNNSLHSEQT